MMPDIVQDSWTIIVKEWREWCCIRARVGWSALFLLIVTWSFAAPHLLGSFAVGAYLVPVLWAALPVTLAGVMIIDSIAGERERQTLETLLASRLSERAIVLGKVVAITLLGWLLLAFSALPGIIRQALTPGVTSVAPATIAAIVFGVITPAVLLIVLAGALITLYTSSMRFALLLTIALAGFLILGATVLVIGWSTQSDGAIGSDMAPLIISAASLTALDSALLGWLFIAVQSKRLLAIG